MCDAQKCRLGDYKAGSLRQCSLTLKCTSSGDLLKRQSLTLLVWSVGLSFCISKNLPHAARTTCAWAPLYLGRASWLPATQGHETETLQSLWVFGAGCRCLGSSHENHAGVHSSRSTGASWTCGHEPSLETQGICLVLRGTTGPFVCPLGTKLLNNYFTACSSAGALSNPISRTTIEEVYILHEKEAFKAKWPVGKKAWDSLVLRVINTMLLTGCLGGRNETWLQEILTMKWSVWTEREVWLRSDACGSGSVS